ncbi:hypothetical protein 2L372D_162 [Aeromonas phage 2L372D]|uniref:5'-3' exonuclease n=1 Tax=Aeromonas phage 2L372D TaxID=2588097 RepID=A0A4Y5TZJ7_9CAUD|nr:hypothetical protein HWC25_gp162 [Aeromonas phage 2L372D]QDB74076.1 hypothetical protein 2L372D_162 [Aeromonas phage 2L372D]
MTQKYKMCHVDFDTCLFRAAKSCQKDYIIVTHKETGWKQRFDGVSKFYGLGKQKNKGWIGEQNAIREKQKKPLISADDFIIEECAELVDIEEVVLKQALDLIDFTVGRIKKASEAEDYRLYIAGTGNWRYDAANILPYKGNRKPKPIFFLEVKEALIQKYKNKIVIVDNAEVDDKIGEIGWQNYLNFRKTGKWEHVLSYIDKDLKMIISPHFNYDKCDEGVEINTPEEAAKWFCLQLLVGDKTTDNIQGLPNLSPEFQEKYELRKCRGLGKETALKILEGKNIKESFEVVVEAYKSYYGEDKKKLLTFRGEELEYNWLDYLKENGLLLWMRREPDEMYNIEDTLKRLGIEY